MVPLNFPELVHINCVFIFRRKTS